MFVIVVMATSFLGELRNLISALLNIHVNMKITWRYVGVYIVLKRLFLSMSRA